MRTLKELLEVMKGVALGFPEAMALVGRLNKRAVWVEVSDKGLVDPEGVDFVLRKRTRRKKPVFVVSLGRGSQLHPNFYLVARSHVQYNGGKKVASSVLVSSEGCHEDWLGLGLIHEFGCLELEEVIEDIDAAICLHNRFTTESSVAALFKTSAKLERRHGVMISQLLDRMLRGRISGRVSLIRKRQKSYGDHEQFSLAKEILHSIALDIERAWPSPSSLCEESMRDMYLRSAAMVLLNKGFVEADPLN
jgi:hypothetical protein